MVAEGRFERKLSTAEAVRVGGLHLAIWAMLQEGPHDQGLTLLVCVGALGARARAVVALPKQHCSRQERWPGHLHRATVVQTVPSCHSRGMPDVGHNSQSVQP
jgi:hypothetical protein